MSMFHRTTWIVAGFGLAALAGVSGASATTAQSGQNCTSPPGMNYMICNGQRVPKPTNRVVNADGSWREETRQGKCVVIKEKSASGEYKETRRCD
ncbi:hypothetical protein [Sphingomonas arenae]|uniref:hypothetical protein n=1 Tax=Sphingomonas arenae TaxID=2812555 RepID=UPI001966E5A7|nr:hypothetical protein [Sphingomonas arenae]